MADDEQRRSDDASSALRRSDGRPLDNEQRLQQDPLHVGHADQDADEDDSANNTQSLEGFLSDGEYFFKEMHGVTLYRRVTKKEQVGNTGLRQLLSGLLTIKNKLDIGISRNGHQLTVTPLGGTERTVFLPCAAHSGELMYGYLNPITVGAQVPQTGLHALNQCIEIEGKGCFRALKELIDTLKIAHRKKFPRGKRGYIGAFVNKEHFFLAPGVKFSKFGKRMLCDWEMVAAESTNEGAKGAKKGIVELSPLPYLPLCGEGNENNLVMKELFQSAKDIGGQEFVSFLSQAFGAFSMALRFSWVHETINLVPVVILIGHPSTFKSGALEYFKAIVGLRGAANLVGKSALSSDQGPFKVCDDPLSLSTVSEELKAISDQSTSFTRKRGYESKQGVCVGASNRKLSLGSQEPMRLKRRLLLIPSVSKLGTASAENTLLIEKITSKECHNGIASNVGKFIGVGNGLDGEEAKKGLKKSADYVTKWIAENEFTNSVHRPYSILHYFIGEFLNMFQLTGFCNADETFSNAAPWLKEYLSDVPEESDTQKLQDDREFLASLLLSTMDALLSSDLELSANEALYTYGLAWKHEKQDLIIKSSFIPKPNNAAVFIKALFPAAEYQRQQMGDDPQKRPKAWKVPKADLATLGDVVERLKHFVVDYSTKAATHRATREDLETSESNSNQDPI